ncbi:hypothetical protein POF50_012240 [Streptomyces sp. SL13]|uniref:Saccharopine dehydrogenase NADP binding domain-containing protein n=1 Tax=Streptantibioticus silvisoli TaxID=2705255 RepID=A0AA90GXQ7_9ACTN|nr:hypothetical protein [Streptantibioticus silvisoli]MDI5970098.1 hypothetical protein [Streptantibioticus silvisoli]
MPQNPRTDGQPDERIDGQADERADERTDERIDGQTDRQTDERADERTGEVWILGATGRIGRAVAARLVARGRTPVLVGRDRERLRGAAADLGRGDDVRIVLADTAERVAAEITRRRPGVVVNTIGDYAATATVIARACMPGGHYVDLAADLAAVPRLLGLHDEATAAGSTLVTGAGFGVLATEAVVARLCEGRPTPREVRVDALSSVATEAGTMGAAFAGSVVGALTTGGRRYDNGRLVRTRLGANPREVTLPDGQRVKSAGAPRPNSSPPGGPAERRPSPSPPH